MTTLFGSLSVPRSFASALVAGALALASVAFAEGESEPAPLALNQIVAARPFVLQESFTWNWRQERPQVASGWLLVIEIPPALCAPRQTADRVIYVGGETAERLNLGTNSGHIVLIVPAPLMEIPNPNDPVQQPLDKHPVFLGATALPEQVTLSSAETQLLSAEASGIPDPDPAVVAAARLAGGPLLQASSRAALLAAAAQLVQTYSPDEVDCAELLAGIPVSRIAE